MYEAHSISLHYGDKEILQNCSLQLKPKQLTAIIGKNGSGKTTMLKALCNELKPTRGYISLDQTNIAAYSRQELATRRAVFNQHQAISFGFTVRETVAMGRTPHHKSAAEQNNRVVQKCMELTEVEHLADRDIRRLSGGERQRVHISRVIAQLYDQEPSRSYFFFDEATNNLDIYHQFKMMLILRQLADMGFGVCIVAHDLNLISEYTDHVVFVDQGQIIAEGKPEDILERERLSSVYKHAIQVIKHPVKDHQLIVY
jgi:iron complex transport system ATP-binding protein